MGSSNGAHRVRRRRIIEKNAAAAVDLQVDEARRKHRPGRHDFGRPVARAPIARRDVLNHPTLDQDDRIIVPAVAIENAVSRNRQPGCSAVFGWLQAHRLTFLTGRLAGPINPLADCMMHRLGARYAIMRAELREPANVPEGGRRNVGATRHRHFRG
jgi:hypothetical protein